ncbi:hypothetical protein ABT095_38750, partial [Kitasatospora sp. NPDC002227]|uniref:hypothetical protein n=1 Tax=Kitasatospora sp. NPDC002227 TaxID=3154773 RepID=UPI003332CC7F
RIDSTIRTFSSGGSAGGLTMIDQTPSSSRTRKKRALPQSLTRDNATPHQVELVDAWTARFEEGERGMRVLLAALVEQAQLLQGDPAGGEELLAAAEMLLLGQGQTRTD